MLLMMLQQNTKLLSLIIVGMNPTCQTRELLNEFKDGVRMFGYVHNNQLIGVIGYQEINDVVLIRHAYTLTTNQGKGTGSALLEFLLNKNQNSRLLIGTWKSAKWAIRFYEKFGFVLHAKDESALLLKKILEHTIKTN